MGFPRDSPKNMHFYNVCQLISNACAYNNRCVYVLDHLSNTMQGHIWMQCVCLRLRLARGERISIP